ncbi:MAG TPA: lamin tail domain-containing protein, partial [Verrucomicrobiota bacterium]|nr:lamin tail domain-containing protein [Verrucomicrobiota bacterium]
LSTRTLGAPNAAARVGPVIFNEIHYQPMTLLASGPTEQPAEEFLELHNLSAAPVPLFDPAAPTNTWRVSAGVDFTFPPGVTLPAGGFAVLVRFNPADAAQAAVFRANFGVPDGVPLFGPFSGRLANEGEELRLERPDTPQGPGRPDAGFVPYVPVDRVHYAPAAPWPAGAAGTGASLQRRQPGLYGNDPAHWLAAAPTPGRPTTPPANDRDGDGMPDDWEILHGLDPDDPSDALLDADGDGVPNVLEYLSGTDPRDAASFLRVDIARETGGTVLFFRAVAGRSYTLLHRDAVSDGRWRRLLDVPAAFVNRDLRVPDLTAKGAAERYYRLVTPALPAGLE